MLCPANSLRKYICAAFILCFRHNYLITTIRVFIVKNTLKYLLYLSYLKIHHTRKFDKYFHLTFTRTYMDLKRGFWNGRYYITTELLARQAVAC
jgi:hypothetical protein